MKLYEIKIIKEIEQLDEVFADTIRHAMKSGFKVHRFSSTEGEDGSLHQTVNLRNEKSLISVARILKRDIRGVYKPVEGGTNIYLTGQNGGAVEIPIRDYNHPESIIDKINGALKFGGFDGMYGNKKREKNVGYREVKKDTPDGDYTKKSTDRYFN